MGMEIATRENDISRSQPDDFIDGNWCPSALDPDPCCPCDYSDLEVATCHLPRLAAGMLMATSMVKHTPLRVVKQWQFSYAKPCKLCQASKHMVTLHLRMNHAQPHNLWIATPSRERTFAICSKLGPESCRCSMNGTCEDEVPNVPLCCTIPWQQMCGQIFCPLFLFSKPCDALSNLTRDIWSKPSVETFG